MKNTMTTMKVAAIALVGMLGLAACQPAPKKTAAPAGDAAAGAGNAQPLVIRFGTDATYEPFEYTNDKGEVIGFDIDTAKLICEEIKAQCTFVNQAWDGIIPGLQAKKYDVIMSSMAITPERKQSVDFSNKTSDTPNAFLAKEGANLEISDAGFKGKSIAVQHGTVQDFYATKYYPSAKVKRYKTTEDAYADLISGRADVVFSDAMILSEGFMKSPQAKGFAILPTTIPNSADSAVLGDGVGMAVRKGDKELLDQLNKGLDAILKNGKYKALATKYFGDNAKYLYSNDANF